MHLDATALSPMLKAFYLLLEDIVHLTRQEQKS